MISLKSIKGGSLGHFGVRFCHTKVIRVRIIGR